jgi:hypothetical protein
MHPEHHSAGLPHQLPTCPSLHCPGANIIRSFPVAERDGLAAFG